MAAPDGSADSGLSRAVKSRTAHIVHLTHNDLDAVGADAIYRRKFGPEGVFTIWCSVGKFPQLFQIVASCEGKGDLLTISDLGYPAGGDAAVAKAKKNGWRVEWRDHHRWRDEEIARARQAADLLVVDSSTCGAGLVARDVAPDDPVAGEVARVVCDYDLWKHADPRSAVLGLVLQRKDNRDHVRDCLARGVFSDDLIEREHREIRQEMETAMEKSRQHATFAGTKYRIAFAPLYGYPSETAHYIRDKEKTDIEVIIGKDGKFSIRSVPPVSHLIAREFGGGGHPGAAGGSFNFTILERFTWWLLKKSRHFDELVKAAEKY